MLAVESMIALANNLWFSPGIEIANAILVRKSIAARETQATVETAMEVCGGASFYREFELERLYRDVYAGHYHPLPEIKQQLMTGRLTLGRNPMTGAQRTQPQAAD
jgi:alkylation response protein AidB-like acyl-CoA dehydrogenase